MRKVLSITVFVFFLSCPLLSSHAQQSGEQQKPAPTKGSDGGRKAERSGLSAALSGTASQENVANGTVPKTEDGATSIDPVVDAQKYYETGTALSEAGKLEEAINAF